jgi:hypothetical protein
MKPMFLPEVEANPQPSPVTDLICIAQSNAVEYPKIWHLFGYRPEATAHFGRVHASDHARRGAAQPRDSGVDCGVHFAS